MFVLFWGLAVGVARSNSVTPTNIWVNLYSTNSTLAGQPLPVGAYVAVFDPQGTQCGEFTVHAAGWYGLVACYGDDGMTPQDEGAASGDPLLFKINGQTATTEAIARNGVPVAPGTPVAWTQHGDRWEVNLNVSTAAVAISQTAGLLTLGWLHQLPKVTAYEVWRSGEPYFAPGQAGAGRLITLTPGAEPWLTWSDPDSSSGPTGANYYRVRGLNAALRPVNTSRPVARLAFSLVVTGQ